MEVWEKYPEVFHYTGAEGLQGIVTSQTLFATRYDHLNDRSELSLLRDALPKLLEPTVKKFILERWHGSAAYKREIRKNGGVPKVSAEIAADLATIHFDTAFKGGEGVPAVTAPFVTSFCGHVDSYESEHGLLSQWRAYGKGGFSIVFDTKKLWQLCLKEKEAYAYAFMMLDDVVYEDDVAAFERDIEPAIQIIKDDIDLLLHQRTDPADTSFKEKVTSIMMAFTRLKHRGFKEEKEVRIVACPVTADAYVSMAKDFDQVRKVPIKKLRQCNESEVTRPQIELFDFDDAGPLPIKRIIVGPQEDQESAISLAKSLIKGTTIRVTASETPLVQWPDLGFRKDGVRQDSVT